MGEATVPYGAYYVLSYYENFIILTSTVFIWSTRVKFERQTDRRIGKHIVR